MSDADNYRDLATEEVRAAQLDLQDQHTYFLDRAKVYALLAIEARLGELVEQGKSTAIQVGTVSLNDRYAEGGRS